MFYGLAGGGGEVEGCLVRLGWEGLAVGCVRGASKGGCVEGCQSRGRCAAVLGWKGSGRLRAARGGLRDWKFLSDAARKRGCVVQPNSRGRFWRRDTASDGGSLVWGWMGRMQVVVRWCAPAVRSCWCVLWMREGSQCPGDGERVSWVQWGEAGAGGEAGCGWGEGDGSGGEGARGRGGGLVGNVGGAGWGRTGWESGELARSEAGAH